MSEIIIVGQKFQGASLPLDALRRIEEKLLLKGVNIHKISFVGDSEEALEKTMRESLDSAAIDYIIITRNAATEAGDIASKAASKVTGGRLAISSEIVNHVKRSMKEAGKTMTPADERQALVPIKARIVRNKTSDEYGYTLDHSGKTMLFLPFSEGESDASMDGILDSFLLSSGASRDRISHDKLLHIFGLDEEELKALATESLSSFEGVKIFCREMEDEILLHISANGKGREKIIEETANALNKKIGDSIFAEDEGSMEETVAALLAEKGESLSLAESCTGGYIGFRLTKVPGSSEFLEMGVVAYSNESKSKLLGVQPERIEEFGAVSSETAIDMAEGARKMGRTSFGLSVTGIAGPSGGSEEKPVGTVFIGLSSAQGSRYEAYEFSGNRESVRRQSAQAALDLLRKELLGS